MTTCLSIIVNITLCIIGIIAGSLVTWAVSRHYYMKASKELKDETLELRRLNNIMLLGMEHAGWIELQRDSLGRIIGFKQVIEPQGGNT
jgi:hypothetical protein